MKRFNVEVTVVVEAEDDDAAEEFVHDILDEDLGVESFIIHAVLEN